MAYSTFFTVRQKTSRRLRHPTLQRRTPAPGGQFFLKEVFVGLAWPGELSTNIKCQKTPFPGAPRLSSGILAFASVPKPSPVASEQSVSKLQGGVPEQGDLDF